MSTEPTARRGPKPQPEAFRAVHRCTVYLTVAEIQQLRVKAARDEIAMSELLRDAFLNLLSDAEDP